MSENAPRDDAGEALGYLNVGTGIDLSIYELAKKWPRSVGFNGSIEWDPSKPDGTPKKQLDVSRLTAMGWKARIQLTEGLPMAYSDFLNKLADETLRDKKRIELVQSRLRKF